MTVLGKVTVPKPINLPSQRLENHGLDPNVEIVPKGTLNWGNRTSSSSQNPWAAPAQSPPKNGAVDLSNHLNGRPSSGGSGRPSTAGSDKSHEPVPNVWGSSSRPSSASGISTSNQSSLAAARPRSAEPRPASSQLSRFAEPVFENSVAWSTSGTMEKLGAPSSKAKDFSLSTGDFPTLGSEKTTESHMQQDGHISQGRPVSSSGRAAIPNQRSENFQPDDASLNARRERGPVNTLENDNILEVEVGDSPSMEKWHRENRPYPDQQHLPQQFGPWHGTPHPPNGVWYRGPFGGPYGPPGPPGSYPHDPFAYYHPRLPARPAANLQPVLQPGSAPSGYYPETGDSHRPHMPDSYIPPVMPFGPGPYPVQMPYDGYYGPQRVGISNERRPPSMGMGSTHVYNRYPVRNTHPDSGSFHGPSGYGPSSTNAMEQGGSGLPHGNRQGPYKVLMKHHDGWDENDGKDRREHAVSTPCLDRDNQPGTTPTRKTGQTTSSHYADFPGVRSPKSVDSGLPGSLSNDNRVEDNLTQKSEPASYPGDGKQPTSAKRNSTLIEKIEGLNQKARVYRASNSKVDDSSSEAYNPNKAPISGTLSSPSIEMNATIDVPRSVQEPQIMIHRNAQKRPHGVQDKIDDRSRARSNSSKDEEWIEKPHGVHFPVEGLSKKDEICADGAQDHHAFMRVEKLNSNKNKPAGSKIDSNDHQRAKMKEIVAERAKQLQKEEEERIREQKARALAKLEELDRRKLSENPTEKVVHALPQPELAQEKHEKPLVNTSPVTDANTSTGACSSSGLDTVTPSGWDYATIIPTGWDSDTETPSGLESNTHGNDMPCDLPEKAPLEAPQAVRQARNVKYKPPEIEMKEVRDGNGHRQKQNAFKKKQNIGRSSNDKFAFVGDSGQIRTHANVLGDVNPISGEVNLNSNPTAKDDKHKKKNSRVKNKNKLDEVPSDAHSPKGDPIDGSSLKSPVESSKPKTSVAVFEVGSVQVPFSIEIAESQDPVVISTDQGRLLPTELHGAVNNQLKPHHPRRPRNTQVSEKFHGSEAVVWAPVGLVKKTTDSEDTRLNSAVEVSPSPVVGRETQSNHKSRRAEMERYVPKPVAKEAKEHLVQGNTEPTQSSSINQSASNGITGRAESSSLNKEIGGPTEPSTGKGGGAAVSKVGEGKHNKHVKTHGLWRPRVTGEASLVQPSPDESNRSPGPSNAVQKLSEQHQTTKAETSFPEEQEKYPDISNASTSSLNKPPGNSTGKDHGVTGRGKRQPFKGPKSGGNTQTTSDRNDLHGQDKFEAVPQSSPEPNKLDGRVALGEKYIESNKASHWQPKSQAHPALNHQEGGTDSGGQKANNRISKAPTKSYPSGGGEHPASRTDKDYNQSQLHPHSDRFNGQKTSVAGGPQKMDLNSSRQGRPVHEPNLSNLVKQKDPPENMNSQKEQFFPVPRRQGNQSRLGGTHEDHGAHDNGRQQLPQSSDRRKQDSHYEYQRARSNGNEPDESFDEGPRVTGSRYRERGRPHPRQGGVNSYVRDSHGEQNP